MNNTIVSLILNTQNLNRSALTDALKDFEYQEYLPGCYFLKDTTPDAVYTRLQSVVAGADSVAIFPVDWNALKVAKLPPKVLGYIGQQKAA